MEVRDHSLAGEWSMSSGSFTTLNPERLTVTGAWIQMAEFLICVAPPWTSDTVPLCYSKLFNHWPYWAIQGYNLPNSAKQQQILTLTSSYDSLKITVATNFNKNIMATKIPHETGQPSSSATSKYVQRLSQSSFLDDSFLDLSHTNTALNFMKE